MLVVVVAAVVVVTGAVCLHSLHAATAYDCEFCAKTLSANCGRCGVNGEGVLLLDLMIVALAIR